MTKNDDLIITPISVKDFTCKQSKHPVMPKLPLRCGLVDPVVTDDVGKYANRLLNHDTG